MYIFYFTAYLTKIGYKLLQPPIQPRPQGYSLKKWKKPWGRDRTGLFLLVTLGAFHLPKNLKKLLWKCPSSENVFHLTQVPFVYALVTSPLRRGFFCIVGRAEKRGKESVRGMMGREEQRGDGGESLVHRIQDVDTDIAVNSPGL